MRDNLLQQNYSDQNDGGRDLRWDQKGKEDYYPFGHKQHRNFSYDAERYGGRLVRVQQGDEQNMH